ncbi:MAG: hypothetical protein JJLCMIEE_01632 [Acidimicrobiales bacterium]|nr:MAG: maleylpyruvate isomerase family mycothiol-dependent enzyme [Actinomycetota bacterium]MBV6508568.1 hypothetical protein [Acidimicrobiales bacterium]RIK05122.1 MAG: hypothetical protein DCC48_10900 [Acidobacteriota bacterium]
MANAVTVALEAERLEVLRLGGSLTDDEWNLPSDCEGWTVKDVLAHLVSVFHIDLATLKVLAAHRDGNDVERINDQLVELRASSSAGEILGEYERWSRRAMRVMSLLQRRPLRDLTVGMGGLGRHPLRLLANAIVFDHYVHLRYDILAPTGPVDRPQPPHDGLRLEPIVEWCTSGLPQMSGPALYAVTAPVTLDLRGPGGGTWVYEPPRGGEKVGTVSPGGSTGVAATIRSTTDEFLVWGTRRRDWHTREVEIDGDKDLAERFLDNVNIV